MKTALVTGITGQHGAFPAELLLARGYQAHGIERRSPSFDAGRIDNFSQNATVERFGRTVARVAGYGGEVAFEPCRRGTPRTFLDPSRPPHLGSRACTALEKSSCADFCASGRQHQ